VTYALEEDGDLLPLDDVQWADWSADGRLLVATVDGRLEVREGDARGVAVVSEVADLAALRPDPQAPPADAFHW
jgi:hypothetical protein